MEVVTDDSRYHDVFLWGLPLRVGAVPRGVYLLRGGRRPGVFRGGRVDVHDGDRDYSGVRSMTVLTRALAILLFPVVLLERKFVDDKVKEKYGAIAKKESWRAQGERWGMMILGGYCGVGISILPSILLIGLAVTAGFLIAGFIDPFIWARKNGMQMFNIEKKDFKLGVIVNLAPIWMFWVGFGIGGVLVGI